MHLEIKKLPFNTDDEKKIYNQIHNDAFTEFQKYARRGKVKYSITAIFELMIRLRQACLHPNLFFQGISKNMEDVDFTKWDNMSTKMIYLQQKLCNSSSRNDFNFL